MLIGVRLVAYGIAAAMLAGCSSVSAPTPTLQEVATEAVSAMGGVAALEEIRLIVSTGSGTRILGEAHGLEDGGGPVQLSNLIETVDLASGRAACEYDVERPGFMQHRREVITKVAAGLPVGLETVADTTTVTSVSGLMSWAAQNSPDALLRRNVVPIAIAMGRVDPGQAVDEQEFNGKITLHGTIATSPGEQIDVYFDPETRRLEGFRTTDTEPMLGAVPAEYILSDYRAVGNVTLPHRVTIRKQGTDYADVQYLSITINDEAAADVFTIPETLASEANLAARTDDYTPRR